MTQNANITVPHRYHSIIWNMCSGSRIGRGLAFSDNIVQNMIFWGPVVELTTLFNKLLQLSLY